MLSSCHHDRKMLGLDEQHRNVFDISMDKQDIYIILTRLTCYIYIYIHIRQCVSAVSSLTR